MKTKENSRKMLQFLLVLQLFVLASADSFSAVNRADLELLMSQMKTSKVPVPARDLDQLMEAELSESSPGVMAAIYSWLGSLFDSGSGSKKIDEVIKEKRVALHRNSSLRIPAKQPLTNFINPELELLDEVNDGEIFRSVLNSLAEWNLNKVRRKKQNRKKRDEEVVCYPDVGCFRDEGPFDYLDLLPSPPEEINTLFYLYTPRNPDSPHIMSYNNVTSILSSPFNNSNPSKVIIHGFGSSCKRVWAREMRLALMSLGNLNVICVDWENGASTPNYVRAAVNTRLVGKQVALLISALNTLTNTSNADFHLVGFSLGAHVAGFAGSELRNVSRITGLDPAGPLFENYDPRARLDSSDADLVDVIHSNGESLIMGGLGAWAPMGHMDFYPNGGRMQKGCSNLFIGAVSDIIIRSSAEENGRSLCNHRRAYKFFTDSVIPGCHFPAFACESYEKLLEGDCFPCADLKQCANMGYFADKSNGRGVLYLATREEEPFCANQLRLQLHSTPSRQPFYTHGKIEITLTSDNINETFSLTKGPDEEIHTGGRLLRLVVAHPSLTPPTKVRVTYTAYNGWLSSGLSYWSIDKILLMDSFANTVSFCQRGLVLQSGVPAVLNLVPGDCNMATLPNLDSGLPWQPSDNFTSFPEGDASSGLEAQFSPNALRSFRENYNASVNNTIDKMSPFAESFGPQQPSNQTSNVFPYGNVPLAFLQQQLPAEIKVATRRPSFYQWPFVSAVQVKDKLKSLRSGRKQEPQSQLIPPQPAPNSRRSYFRRSQRQRNRNLNPYPPPQQLLLQPYHQQQLLMQQQVQQVQQQVQQFQQQQAQLQFQQQFPFQQQPQFVQQASQQLFVQPLQQQQLQQQPLVDLLTLQQQQQLSQTLQQQQQPQPDLLSLQQQQQLSQSLQQPQQLQQQPPADILTLQQQQLSQPLQQQQVQQQPQADLQTLQQQQQQQQQLSQLLQQQQQLSQLPQQQPQTELPPVQQQQLTQVLQQQLSQPLQQQQVQQQPQTELPPTQQQQFSQPPLQQQQLPHPLQQPQQLHQQPHTEVLPLQQQQLAQLLQQKHLSQPVQHQQLHQQQLQQPVQQQQQLQQRLQQQQQLQQPLQQQQQLYSHLNNAQFYHPGFVQNFNDQLTMPVDHMQQTLAYSLLSQNGPYFPSLVTTRNVIPSLGSAVAHSSFSSTPILQYLPVLNQTLSQTTANPPLVSVSTVTQPLVTVSTTTIEPAGQAKTTEPGDLVESESVQSIYQKTNSEQDLVLTGVEAPLLSAGKTPGSRELPNKNNITVSYNLKINDAILAEVVNGTLEQVSEPSVITSPPITIINATNEETEQRIEPQITVEIIPVDIPVTKAPELRSDEETEEDFDFNKEPLPVSFPITMNRDPIPDSRRKPANQAFREVSPEQLAAATVEPRQESERKENSNAQLTDPYPFSWSYFTDAERVPYVRYMFGNGDVSLALQPEDLFPNPTQLGQARDQYWSRDKKASPALPPWVTGATVEVPQQPRYIPLNPADRQSRMIQPQYYIETSGPVSNSKTPKYTEYVHYPSLRS